MKYVRIHGGRVAEILPVDDVEKFYGAKFAALCVPAPDDIRQGMAYDGAAKTFAEYIEPEAPAEPELDPITQLQIAIAELAELVVGGGA